MGAKGYIKYISIFIVTTFALNILFISTFSYEPAFAKKNDDGEDKNEKDKNQLIVKAKINLKNLDMEKTNYIRIIGFINGEESKQDIPISSIDKTKKTLNVDLKVNEENEIVKAKSPDEFFVCAYQVADGQQQQEFTSIPKFDCNEGDILGN